MPSSTPSIGCRLFGSGADRFTGMAGLSWIDGVKRE
jgi:hypothetical protein